MKNLRVDKSRELDGSDHTHDKQVLDSAARILANKASGIVFVLEKTPMKDGEKLTGTCRVMHMETLSLLAAVQRAFKFTAAEIKVVEELASTGLL